MLQEIPHFVLPERLSFGKFIQVYVKGQPFFRAEEFKEESHHALMLSQLLTELGVQFITFDEYDHGIGRNIKCPYVKKGELYELVGAGRITKITLNNDGRFMLSGDSATYEIRSNQKHLDDLTSYISQGIKLIISRSD